MTMKIIILRTHYYCPHWHAALKLLKNTYNMQVVILADMSRQIFEYPGLEHILFSDAACQSLGLGISDNYRWRCGDYCYYLTYQKYQFSHAWLIESDVFIPEKELHSFFSKFDNDPVTFLCSYYKKADENWYWSKIFSASDLVYSCFLPVTRLAGHVVPELIKKRVLEGGATNDEAFLATTLTDIATVKDFSQFSHQIYDNLSFCYRVPKWRSGLIFLARHGFLNKALYHPVVERRVLFRKYFKKSYLKASILTFFQNLIMKNKYKNF